MYARQAPSQPGMRDATIEPDKACPHRRKMIDRDSSYSSIHTSRTGKASDKWDLYLDVYDRLLDQKGRKGEVLTILEIGIQNGGSLETWAELMPFAQKIIGCDIDQQCQNLVFDDPRISTIIGDANTDHTEALIRQASPAYDLAIDDGSHTSRDIIGNFIRYFPLLNPGGTYIAEDLHCCYWREYGGGLGAAESGIEFFKLLVDCINSNNWGRSDIDATSYISGLSSTQQLNMSEESLGSISSIQFFDSLCIIQKAGCGLPSRIGTRVVSGDLPQVEAAVLALNGNTLLSPDQSNNRWINPQASAARIRQLEQQLACVLSSRSWRLTEPFRKVVRKVRSIISDSNE